MPYGPYDGGGGVPKFGDPLRIYRRLLTGLGGDPNALLSRFGNLADDAARDKVVQAAGWAFEMQPFDPKTGKGADEALVESTLTDFLGWLEKNEPTVPGPATWSQPTAPESSPSTGTAATGCTSG